MERGGHGLPRVSQGLATPYPSMPCGRPPLKRLYGCFRGGYPQSGRPAAIFFLLGHPIPYASVSPPGMEKTLKELETIWADMEFTTQAHESSGMTLLVARDELIEQLEGDQVGESDHIVTFYIMESQSVAILQEATPSKVYNGVNGL
jgi:hypothetical protein